MKLSPKISTFLKFSGWAVLCLALAVSLYAFANDAAAWQSMYAKLASLGAAPGALERIPFGSRYYSALAAAAGCKNFSEEIRAEKVSACLSAYRSAAESAEYKIAEDRLQAQLGYFENEFDETAFLASRSNQKNDPDERTISECIEYFDTHVRLPGKGKLKPASCRPDVEKFYRSFAEEHGEEAGTLCEFLQAMTLIAKKDAESGVTFTSVKNYLAAIRFDTFSSALQEIRTAEKSETENLQDEFAETVSARVSGAENTYSDFFSSVYKRMRDSCPGENLGTEDMMVSSFRALIEAGNWDGSMLSLVKAVRAASAEKPAGFDAFLEDYAEDIIIASDSSGSAGAIVLLWKLCSCAAFLWAAGIAMLAASAVIGKLIFRAALSRIEERGQPEEEEKGVLLRVSHLKQYFFSGNSLNKAVDDVSFCIKKGEVFGLVGESGCGKTTLGRTIINLYDPTGGDVRFQGLCISSTQNGLPALIRSIRKDFRNGKISREEMRRLIGEAREKALESSAEKERSIRIFRERRKAELKAQYEKELEHLAGDAAKKRTARYRDDLKAAAKEKLITRIQMIFQDPIASIDPRMTVREIIAEGLRIRGVRDEKYIDEQISTVLEQVGLVREHANRYPHEFSGGQRQRIGIARAITLNPDLIIADEPISALDVSIQAQVINMFADLQESLGLTYLFIAHDLLVVRHISNRIAVMYLGKMVELADAGEIYDRPLHPYSKSLLSAVPIPDPKIARANKRIPLVGDIPSPLNAPSGCPFRTRCAYAKDICAQSVPPFEEVAPGHYVACHRINEIG